MYGQAHGGLGWLIGCVAPGSDRRMRAWCTTAAILPDIDALPHLWSAHAFDAYHHTFGHNIWLGGLAVVAAACHHRDRPWRRRIYIAVLVGVCFASHLLTDMKLSGWAPRLLWPISNEGFQIRPVIQLGHAINDWLAYGLMLAVIPLAILYKVTPLEIFSTRLNRNVINVFRKRELACATCERKCNNRCDGCEKPTCMRHAKLGWTMRISCPDCHKSSSG